MPSFVYSILAGIAALAALAWCLAAGFRNGDRPADAGVRAVPQAAGQPGERRPVIVATVRNPSGAPVLVALAGRGGLLPGWLAEPMNCSVPRRTVRRKFRPGGYPTVGVVPAGGAADFAVPVPASARRYLLTVLVGQHGGRLRRYRLRVDAAAAPAGGPRTWRARRAGTGER